MESGEVRTELRNTLGRGKMQESGNAEGARKRKCGRSRNAEGAEMRKTRESGKAECDRIVGRWMNRRVTDGWTDGKEDGWTEGRKEGRTDGRTEGRMEGWTDGRTDRRMEGRTDGRKEGRTDVRKDGTYCAGVKDLASAYVLCPRLTEQCVSFYLEGSGDHGKGLGKGYGGRGQKECGKTE